MNATLIKPARSAGKIPISNLLIANAMKAMVAKIYNKCANSVILTANLVLEVEKTSALNVTQAKSLRETPLVVVYVTRYITLILMIVTVVLVSHLV